MEQDNLGQWVEVNFDCLPLRSFTNLSEPDDASPKFVEKLRRIKQAIEEHGTHNTYYLHNAECVFHLTNDPNQGMMRYSFEGTIFTDQQDMVARNCELSVILEKETCSWLNQAVVDWLGETVQRAVLVEFNRYIQAGDLSRTIERLKNAQKASDEAGGFVGMYL